MAEGNTEGDHGTRVRRPLEEVKREIQMSEPKPERGEGGRDLRGIPEAKQQHVQSGEGGGSQRKRGSSLDDGWMTAP